MSSILLPFAVPIKEFSTFLLRKRDITSWRPFSFQDAKKISYVLFCSVADLWHFVISWRRRKDGGEKKTQNCVFLTSPRNNEKTQICVFSTSPRNNEKRKIASFRHRHEITIRPKIASFRLCPEITKNAKSVFSTSPRNNKKTQICVFSTLFRNNKKTQIFVFSTSPRNNEKTKWHKSATIVLWQLYCIKAMYLYAYLSPSSIGSFAFEHNESSYNRKLI